MPSNIPAEEARPLLDIVFFWLLRHRLNGMARMVSLF
jgi:hypothetical protein